MSTGISPKFPLSFSDGGDYELNQTYKEVVKQNFKTLLLTNPGEKMMDLDFGIGIQKYLFEQNTLAIRASISSKISSQVKKYMPFMELKDVSVASSNDSDEIVSIKIQYTIVPLDLDDTIDISSTLGQ